MTRIFVTLAAIVAASPAFAASGPFFSLANTDFVVLLAFIVFVTALVYFGVPGMITKMLDTRADGIQSELDEAKKLREEAQALLASYKRKQAEVQEQADAIVANARSEAERAAEDAKAEIKASVARRLASAQEKLDSARAAAEKDVRNQAITTAVAAARDVVARQTSAKDASSLIDEAIAVVDQKLH